MRNLLIKILLGNFINYSFVSLFLAWRNVGETNMYVNCKCRYKCKILKMSKIKLFH